MKRILVLLAATLIATTACKKKADEEPTEENQAAAEAEAEEGAEEVAAAEEEAEAGDAPSTDESPVSTEILEREPVTESAQVKHVLISWEDKASVYSNRGGQDERAADRTLEEANALAAEIQEQGSGDDADFNALMSEYSEDKGSARTGRAYSVTPDAGLVQNFKDLSLRLNVGEVGVVESVFGYHVIKRIE